MTGVSENNFKYEKKENKRDIKRNIKEMRFNPNEKCKNLHIV